MATEVQISVAGSGKTEEIVKRIKAQGSGTRSLALTFTTTGQNEIISRAKSSSPNNHETFGWFAFLVRHIVRPYLPAIFPDIHAHGLCPVQSESDIPRYRDGWKYYFNDTHQPYSVRLAVLAKKVLKETKQAPIRRLEGIYDAIYIDECQDLVGNDREILEELMKSSIRLFVTGDVRQSVLKTSKSDRLNRQYNGVQQVNWFREKAQENLCDVSYSSETSRFNQSIATFSDLIHDPELALPPTTSLQNEITGHDGVFLVDVDEIAAYVVEWQPTILRYMKSEKQLPVAEVMNYGVAKGITRDRTLILATGPVEKWLKTKELLKTASASGFYVAATRARFSVAIATKKASHLHASLHPDFGDGVKLWVAPK